MDKKKAYEIVFKELMECSLFRGIYDAQHGADPAFMYGICTVMENIALNVSEDTYKEFSTLFGNNMIKCQEYAEEMRHAPSYLATVGQND